MMDFDKIARDIANAVSRDHCSGYISVRPGTLEFINRQLIEAFSKGRGPDKTPGKVTSSTENGVRVTVCQ
jgi:hypothetical protein